MSFFREGTENLSQIKIIYENPLLLLISMRIQNLSNKGLIEENKKLLEQLRRALEQADGLEMVFAKHMSKKNGKYILFCTGREHMDEMKARAGEWFKKVDPNPHIYTAYYDNAATSKEFG